jgi:hypothetical protein
LASYEILTIIFQSFVWIFRRIEGHGYQVHVPLRSHHGFSVHLAGSTLADRQETRALDSFATSSRSSFGWADCFEMLGDQFSRGKLLVGSTRKDANACSRQSEKAEKFRRKLNYPHLCLPFIKG